MKTIKEKAQEIYLTRIGISEFSSKSYTNKQVAIIERELFKLGVEFAQRWIPVEEELPTESMYVLLKSDYLGVSIFDVVFFLNGKFYTKNSKPTHWRLIELK